MIKQIKSWINIIDFQQINLLAGNVAFYLVLSVVPIVTLIGVIASMFSISVTALVEFLSESLPTEISDILVPFISGDGVNTGLIIFMTIGFFIASNGPHSIVRAANQLYGNISIGFIKGRIKSFLLTIMLVILFIFMLIALAFGDWIVGFISNLVFFQSITEEIVLIYSLLKWPISFILIFFTLKLFYLMIPNHKVKSKTVNIGSLFTTLGWIVVTIIYSYYVSNIASYDIFYGSLSSIISLMFWTFMIAFILLIGIVINAHYYELDKSVTNNIN